MTPLLLSVPAASLTPWATAIYRSASQLAASAPFTRDPRDGFAILALSATSVQSGVQTGSTGRHHGASHVL